MTAESSAVCSAARQNHVCGMRLVCSCVKGFWGVFNVWEWQQPFLFSQHTSQRCVRCHLRVFNVVCLPCRFGFCVGAAPPPSFDCGV